MNPSDVHQYEELLLAKRKELSATAVKSESVVRGAGGQQGDVIDQANADVEAEIEIRARQSDAQLLRDIDEALIRIRRGTYGICETCKRPIASARLDAVPWTRVCRHCMEHGEQSAA